ncbi:hypothetical protein JSR02_00660 [Candidatus Vidania fulgoroideae]|uniref:Uncharacterized protein n=1 Tax=Candidatus Vidania fulgoroideorum TaxID=881286 RepID=A0A974X730_9PROT|nr:hypothetical protein JSR02_00660 [Candidatus Vidania fulgoroideae]
MFVVFVYNGVQYYLDGVTTFKFRGNFPCGNILITTVLLVVFNGVCYFGMPYITNFSVVVFSSLFATTKYRSLIFKRRHRFRRVVGFKKSIFTLKLQGVYFNG